MPTSTPGSVDSQISRIQEALKSQGHDPGAIDGRMGARTQDAIRAFQASRGLPVTGQMDPQTTEKLGVGRPVVR
jgi:peptidoglycan hydrolase-like protein with peptidoglycan-binding domain